MITVPGRFPARFFIAFTLLVLTAPPARAGTFPYWGLSFGSPDRIAARLGLSFGDHVPGAETEGLALGTGTVAEVAVGQGSGTLGIGKSFIVLVPEEKSLRVIGDLKAMAVRTWDEPRSASPHSTYLGLEGGLSVAVVRFTIGVSKRLEDRVEGDEWLYHWGLGIQVRIGKAKPKE